jgi:predicted enzyme related to lactoylglutathione lyase
MNNNPVGWFEIYVQDMDRAKTFYETVFQVQLARLAPPEPGNGQPAQGGIELWSFPMQSEGYGAPGALVRMEGAPSGANSVLIYFSCADCAVEAARVPGAGGTVFKEKFSIGQYGFIALVTDTEGNMIGLHSMA